MNKRIVIISIIGIIATGLGLFLLFQSNFQSAVITPVGTEDHSVAVESSRTQSPIENPALFTTQDKSFSFEYPSDWTLQDTTPNSESGIFEGFLQSWVLQNYDPTIVGGGGIPENTLKMDFDMTQASDDVTIEQLVPCDGKTVTCDDIVMNGVTFRRGTALLNSGMVHIAVAGIYDSKVIRATALVQSGNAQKENTQIIDSIILSFIPTGE